MFWRKLKEFGAGVFPSWRGHPSPTIPRTAVPNSRHWRAKIREMGGDSTFGGSCALWEQKDESAMIDRFRWQSEAEYQELLRTAATSLAALKKAGYPLLRGTVCR